MYEEIGSVLAITGAAATIAGTLANNLLLDHHLAMKIWRVSNPIMLAWALGYLLGLWNGGLSAGALVVMYAIFVVTNENGLRKKAK